MLDSLTLDQMRVLGAVAETGSFSAAARRLGRVQSAISQSVKTLEDILQAKLFDRSGKTPTLTAAGVAILKDARRVLDGARLLKLHAADIHAGLEPELAFAIDAIFPIALLIASLKAFQVEFPNMPVSVFTETLGGAEQRLRDGVALFAIYPIAATGAQDLASSPFAALDVVQVVAHSHPLAAMPAPITRAMLEPQVQLVLTDRTPLTQNLMGGIVSHNIWRFADLSTRLEFLLAGFGWCNMPTHLVEDHIASGRLKKLTLAETLDFKFQLHVVNERGRAIGRAGLWLIDDLRARLKSGCGGQAKSSLERRADKPSALLAASFETPLRGSSG